MKKIMIVDNEPDQIFTVKTALETLDEEFEVIGVSSGEQCLELLNSGEIPDLILSETKMLGMTGLELSDRLKENPAWQDIPMMFLTRKNKFDGDNSAFSGDNNHIEKPFDVEDLKKRIGTVLNKD